MNNLTIFAKTDQLIESEKQCFMIDDLTNQTDELEELLDQMDAIQRVLQATADVDAKKGLISHEEFEKQVRSWYH